MLFKSYTETDTIKIAKKFAAKLNKGDIVMFYGAVGAGKTVFIRGMAEIICPKAQICSPTFAIMNVYEGIVPVYHFDLYRISDSSEIYESGLDEYIGGDGIALIEWPDIMDEPEGTEVYRVEIKRNLEIDDNYREITISGGVYENTCN